jgi:glycosyltransferase involved in cell wall biosynthesis
VAFNLFNAMLAARRSFEAVVFVDSRFPGVDRWRDLPRTTIIDTPFSEWSRHRAQMWEQMMLPVLARWHSCDLVHHPLNTCPRWKQGVPQVVTVHDLNYLHHPEWFSRSFRRWLMGTTVPGLKAADHVVTISDYVLADVRRTLGIRLERSCRIYNGSREFARSRAVKPSCPPYILAVNAWQPHKNLARLIQAFGRVRASHPDLELHVAGRPQAHFQSQPELRAMLNEPGIRLLGYLSDDELAAAYANARAFCFPSLEEGFGLPILEAMSAGTRVVTSTVSCLPEIAGDAAILVDPLSVAQLEGGIKKALCESKTERSRRLDEGAARARIFNWSDTALEYVRLIEDLLERKPVGATVTHLLQEAT